MYTQSITRNHRTAFLFVIDGSGSMAEKLRFRGEERTKAEVVAAITNSLLFELVERARRSDGVHDYYDIAVLGYSGDNCVESLLSPDGEMVSVRELAAAGIPVGRETVTMTLPDGGQVLREIPAPAWITPRAEGQTPMCEALRRARDLAAAWITRPEHAASFPPVLFNITDGEATDGDEEELRALAAQLRALRTADGNLLIVNIHIAASEGAQSLFFPSAAEADYPNRYAKLLYDASSEMPACFEAEIRAIKGPGAVPPFRGVSYNASPAELVAMLNIGSISVKRA